MFKKSIAETVDAQVNARALFWKAETEYQLNNYNESLISLKQFQQASEAANTTEIAQLDYSLAYVYFKLKNYEQATSYFSKYIKNQNGNP